MVSASTPGATAIKYIFRGKGYLSVMWTKYFYSSGPCYFDDPSSNPSDIKKYNPIF